MKIFKIIIISVSLVYSLIALIVGLFFWRLTGASWQSFFYISHWVAYVEIASVISCILYLKTKKEGFFWFAIVCPVIVMVGSTSLKNLWQTITFQP